MKILKIAGVFILIIALFCGIIKLFSIINNGGRITIDKASESQWREDIEDSWARVEWDTNTFNDNMAKLGTVRNNTRLVEMNYAYALDNLWNAMTNEYHKANCSTTKIENYYKTGILFLKRKSPSLSNDPKYVKLNTLYDLYKKIDIFFTRGFLKKPKKFNPHNSSNWEPKYSKYRSTIETSAANYKRDTSLYNHFKNITRFNDGFRTLSVNLDTAELRYMNAIVSEVTMIKSNTVIDCDTLSCIYDRFQIDFRSIINRNRKALNKANELRKLKCD